MSQDAIISLKKVPLPQRLLHFLKQQHPFQLVSLAQQTVKQMGNDCQTAGAISFVTVYPLCDTNRQHLSVSWSELQRLHGSV